MLMPYLSRFYNCIILKMSLMCHICVYYMSL
nr:MAG TPA: hypothetical protein [Bacteriophage sp.]